jgi:hypothetical protein
MEMKIQFKRFLVKDWENLYEELFFQVQDLATSSSYHNLNIGFATKCEM